MKQIVSMKWGTRYSSEYANRLYKMVKKHTTGEVRFICFTDDSAGLDEGIETHPLPEINLPTNLPKFSAWRKIGLWQDPLIDLKGDVLFLDLDVIITGDIDRFFTYRPGTFCVIKNWGQEDKQIGNTTAYRWPVGKYSYIYERAHTEADKYKSLYPNSQTYISKEIEDINFWPDDWCVSFKKQLLPPWPLRFFIPAPYPEKASIVAFTGKPDPHEAAAGIWPAPWYKKTYKHVRPTKWISENW